MKLGILTYHRAINMGSIVQAYCLQKKLKAQFPDAQIEVIDYRPGVWDYREGTKHLSRRWPFFNSQRYSEVRSIRRFSNANLDLSRSHITTRNLRKSRRWFEDQGYDGIFVGSDTVWEYRPGSYSPPALNEFHLPWPMNAKKFGFAVSADPVPPRGVPDPVHRQAIRRAISDFDVVGIRDDATFQFLNDLGVDTGGSPKILDPTLQVDFTELVEPFKIASPEGKPLAGVAAPANVAEQIAKILRARGFAVWNWGTAKGAWADGCLPSGMSAGEVLGAYLNLSTFVTDRFHGSIFSLRIGSFAPIFIETKKKWAVANSKGRDLYSNLGLSERVLRDDDPDWLNRLSALAADRKAAPRVDVGSADAYFEKVKKILHR